MTEFENYNLVLRIDVFMCIVLCMYQVYERTMIITL